MGGGAPAAAGIATATATATAADALASLLLYVAVVDEPPPAALDAALGEVRAGLTLGEFSSMPDAERAPPPRACRRRRARWRWTRRLARRPDAPAGDEIPGAPAGAGGAQARPAAVSRGGRLEGAAGHRATGAARAVSAGGSEHLRFEDFEAASGPDLRVHLTNGGDVAGRVHVAKPKGSRGTRTTT